MDLPVSPGIFVLRDIPNFGVMRLIFTLGLPFANLQLVACRFIRLGDAKTM